MIAQASNAPKSNLTAVTIGTGALGSARARPSTSAANVSARRVTVCFMGKSLIFTFTIIHRWASPAVAAHRDSGQSIDRNCRSQVAVKFRAIWIAHDEKRVLR
jgi:hypothetical protein